MKGFPQTSSHQENANKSDKDIPYMLLWLIEKTQTITSDSTDGGGNGTLVYCWNEYKLVVATEKCLDVSHKIKNTATI
jgi:hypothetical protein